MLAAIAAFFEVDGGAKPVVFVGHGTFDDFGAEAWPPGGDAEGFPGEESCGGQACFCEVVERVLPESPAYLFPPRDSLIALCPSVQGYQRDTRA